MSKREAVPKHSLPPQKQILSYMGRFINCPYAPDTDRGRSFYLRMRVPAFTPVISPFFTASQPATSTASIPRAVWQGS